MALAPLPFQRRNPNLNTTDEWELIGVPTAPAPIPSPDTPLEGGADGFELLGVPRVPGQGSADNFELIGMAPAGQDPAQMSEWDRTVANPFQRGVEDLRDIAGMVHVLMGTATPEEMARGAVENELRRQALPEHPDDVRFAQELEATEGWDQVGKVISNPRLWAQTFARSLPAAAPSVTAGAVGTVVAGPVGGAVGGAAGSLLTEFNASVMDALREVDPNIATDPQAMLAALNDETIMGRAKEYALKRGLAVAAFDGISMGLAGRVFGPVAGALGGKVAGKVAGVATEGVMQAGLGAGGEAAAQLASTGEIKRPGDVALEALAEVPGGVVETVATAPGRALEAARNAQAQATPVSARPPGAPLIAPEGTPNVAQVDPATDPNFMPAPVQRPAAPAPAAPPVQQAPQPTPTQMTQVPATPILPTRVQAQRAPGSWETPPAAQTPVQQPVAQAPAVTPSVTPSEPIPAPQPVTPPVAAVQPPEPAAQPEPQQVPATPPAPTPPEQTVARRAAPAEKPSMLRFGNALRRVETGLDKAGGTLASRKKARDNIAFMKTRQNFVEDETPQQYRIGDEITLKGSYARGTIISVSNKGGDVSLTMMDPQGGTRVVKPDQLASYQPTAEDNPGPAIKPKWHGKTVDNPRANPNGIKPGDTITTKGGVRGTVVGVWQSDNLGRNEGFNTRPTNVAFIPEGETEGTYRTASITAVQREGGPAVTEQVTEQVEDAPVEDRAGTPAPVEDRADTEPSNGREMAALKIGDRVFTAKTHAKALDKALRAFGPDSPEIAAFEDDPESAIGEWNDKPITKPWGEKRKAGFTNTRVSGDGGAEVRRKLEAARETEDPASPSEEYGVYKDDRRAKGTLAPQTLDVSRTSGPSVFRAAWIAAGLDPDEGNLLPPRQKIGTLRRVLMDTFGFANVVWAGAAPQQAVAQMQNAYRNVQFMMHALGLPREAVSLDGTLTINLENERQQYFGVYDPNNRSIGMPGQSNSFAHEWMHALDHFLGDKLKGGVKSALLSRFAKDQGMSVTTSIDEAFVKLLYTMFFDEADLAARVLDVERKAGETIKSGPKAGQPTAAAILARDQLARLKAGSTRLQIKPTDYAQKSRDFDPGTDYWASAHEMLARAFEAYVANKVESLGGTNEFITKGEEAYLSDADRRLAMTFPKVDDRVRIFAAFDDLFDHLRTNAVLGSGPAASRPDDAGIVDPNRWTKVVVRQQNPGLFDALREEARQYKNMATAAYQRGFWSSLKHGVSSLALNAGIHKGATVQQLLKGIVDYTRFFVFTTRGAIVPLIERNKARKNPKTGQMERGGGDLLADAFAGFATRPGTGTEQAVTYEGESHQQTAKDVTKIENVLRANGVKDLTMSEADQSTVRELMFGRKIPGADPRLVKIASQLRDLFDAAHARAKKAGIKIGYLMDQGYLPRILDMGKVTADPMKFIRQAAKVYRIVFDDLVSDPDFSNRDLISLANSVDRRQGNTTGQNRYAKEIKALRTAMRGEAKAEGEVNALKNSKTATPAQRQAAQQKLAQATAGVQTARDALADAIRDPFAEVSAQDWHTRVQTGNSFTFEGHGPAEKYTENRKLPPAADDLLADFYNTDPVNLTANYVGNMNARVAYVKRAGNPSGNDKIQNVVARKDVRNRIAMNPRKYNLNTEAGRRAIITDLANPAEDNLLEMRLRSAFEMGADAQDVVQVRRAIESIAGRGERGLFADMLSRVSGLIYVYTYIRLLPRMAITALSEPATILLRTGNAKAAFSTFTAYLSELNQKAETVRERQEIAKAIGLVSSPLYDVLLMSRMGMDTGHIASPNVLMAKFFQANWAAAITNAQRRATMLGGFVWMRDMAQKHALSTDVADKKIIEAEFKELGIREQDLTSFMDWLAQSDTLPDLDAMNSKAGRLFESAVYRFVGQVIQDPNRADKPMLASTALGRLVFSLTSFLYTFFSNVHAATVSRTMRDYQIFRDAGSSVAGAATGAVARNAATFVGGFAVIWAGQMMTTIMREFLFNREQWDKHDEDDDLFQWLAALAWSRSGILGPLDLIQNSLTGLKYERDLVNIFTGPGISTIAGDLGKIAAVFDKNLNTPNTNTTEREAAKALYRLVIGPALGAAISAAGTAGPLGELVRYSGLVTLTSNTAAASFADMTVGPKDDGKDKKDERQTPAERRAEREEKREKARAKREEERENRRLGRDEDE